MTRKYDYKTILFLNIQVDLIPTSTLPLIETWK